MIDAPAFDFFPERFLHAVEGWTEGEICRYMRLLSHQWTRDGLPVNLDDLSKLARGKITDRLLAKFPLMFDAAGAQRRCNLFLEKIRGAQRQRIAKRRDGALKTNKLRWEDKKLSDGDSDGDSDGLSESLKGSPPITPTPLLLVKEAKARRRSGGRTLLVDEASATTRGTSLPQGLDNPEFRQAWEEMCAFRQERAATKGIPWTRRAADSMLRECERIGAHWAMIEVRTSVMNCWKGIFPDQRRNPADIRSQPLTSKTNAPKMPEVKQYTESLEKTRAPRPAVIPESERPTAADIAAVKATLTTSHP